MSWLSLFKSIFKTSPYMGCTFLRSLKLQDLSLHSLTCSLQFICWGKKKKIGCPTELLTVWIFLIVLCHAIVPCIACEMGVKSRDLVTLKLYFEQDHFISGEVYSHQKSHLAYLSFYDVSNIDKYFLELFI